MPGTIRPRTMQDEVASARRKHEERQRATIKKVSPMRLSELTQSRESLKGFWDYLGEVPYEDQETGTDLSTLILHLTDQAFPVLESMLFGDGAIADLNTQEKEALTEAEKLFDAVPKDPTRIEMEEEVAALEAQIQALECGIDYEDLEGTDPEGKILSQIEELDKQKTELEPLIEPRDVDILWEEYLNNRKKVRGFLKQRLKKVRQAEVDASAVILKPLNLKKADFAGRKRNQASLRLPYTSNVDDVHPDDITSLDCEEFRTPERMEMHPIGVQTTPSLLEGFIGDAVNTRLEGVIAKLNGQFRNDRVALEKHYEEQSEFELIEAKANLEEAFLKERETLEVRYKDQIKELITKADEEKKTLQAKHKEDGERCLAALKDGLEKKTASLKEAFQAKLEKEKSKIQQEFTKQLQAKENEIAEKAKKEVEALKQRAEKQLEEAQAKFVEKEKDINEKANQRVEEAVKKSAEKEERAIAEKTKELEKSSQEKIAALEAKLKGDLASKEDSVRKAAEKQVAEAKKIFKQEAKKEIAAATKLIKDASNKVLESEVQKIKEQLKKAVETAKEEAKIAADQLIEKREAEINQKAQADIQSQVQAIREQEKEATQQKVEAAESEFKQTLEAEKQKLQGDHDQAMAALKHTLTEELDAKLAEKDQAFEALKKEHEQELAEQRETFIDQAEENASARVEELQEEFEAQMEELEQRYQKSISEAQAAQKEAEEKVAQLREENSQLTTQKQQLEEERQKQMPITTSIGTSPGLPGYRFKTPSPKGQTPDSDQENGEETLTPRHFNAGSDHEGDVQNASTSIASAASLVQPKNLFPASPRELRHVFDTPGRAVMVTGFSLSFLSLVAMASVLLVINPDPMLLSPLSGLMTSYPVLPSLLTFTLAMMVVGLIGVGMAACENKNRTSQHSYFASAKGAAVKQSKAAELTLPAENLDV